MATRSTAQTEVSLPKCASCDCDVGKEAGKIPFFCDDGEKHETFCPRCFVYVRALREQNRFRPGAFVPIKCTGCGLESVSVGVDYCMQCRCPHVIVLAPTPGVV